MCSRVQTDVESIAINAACKQVDLCANSKMQRISCATRNRAQHHLCTGECLQVQVVSAQLSSAVNVWYCTVHNEHSQMVQRANERILAHRGGATPKSQGGGTKIFGMLKWRRSCLPEKFWIKNALSKGKTNKKDNVSIGENKTKLLQSMRDQSKRRGAEPPTFRIFLEF